MTLAHSGHEQNAMVTFVQGRRVPMQSRTETMRFEVRPAESDQWVVFDEDEQSVFTGTYRQCEDWLDVYENTRGRQHGPRSLPRLRRFLTRFWPGARKPNAP